MQQLPLSELHNKLSPKWAEFAGYNMPMLYAGTMAEHNHTRENVAIFDVSHMGQLIISGADAGDFLETMAPLQAKHMVAGKMRYSVFTNENGGIIDDIMVLRRPDDFLVIVNAGNKNKVLSHLNRYLNGDVTLQLLENSTILALQGPKAITIIQEIAPELAILSFLHHCDIRLFGGKFTVSRSGYTGEDGFEFYGTDTGAAERLFTALLSHNAVKPAGLAARDSLRLEAGLCLYGMDLFETTTPIAANLAFVIAQKQNQRFLGHQVISQQIQNGTKKILVALKSAGRQPIRHDTILYDENGSEIGVVTSGTFSPTCGYAIMLGYVNIPASKNIFADVRGQKIAVEITKLPFVPHRYFRGK